MRNHSSPFSGASTLSLFGVLVIAGCGDSRDGGDTSSALSSSPEGGTTQTAGAPPGASPATGNGLPENAPGVVAVPTAGAVPAAGGNAPMGPVSATGGAPAADGTPMTGEPVFPSGNDAGGPNTTPVAIPTVGCSGITAAGWELCSSGPDHCAAVFDDGAGCQAVCAAAGLPCAEVWENADGACSPETSLGQLSCSAPSNHQSDYCLCAGAGLPVGVGGMPGSGGVPTAGGTPGSGGGPTVGGSSGTGGGIMGEGGSPSMGGTPGGVGAPGAAGSPAGDPGNPTTGGPCKPIGWATRDGRTGGAVDVSGGGDATPVVVTSYGELASLAEDDQPRVIHVSGTLGSGWSGTSGDRLEVGSNKTIVGLAPGTQLRAAIHVNGSTNVIIRNLVIRGPGSSSAQAWDNLNIEGGSKNVWIDHCEFWDGQDGNADVVKGADNVTFTFNIFGYRTGGGHNFSNLVASSDNEPQSEGKLNITLMFNWFTGVAQRQPRCRYGDIHVVNNLFSRDGQESDYGISAGKDCRVLTEANHFIGINTPIYTSHASGSAANELRGNNIFEGTSGNTSGFGTAFEPPYEYGHLLVPATEVKAVVDANVGATLESPTQCDW